MREICQSGLMRGAVNPMREPSLLYRDLLQVCFLNAAAASNLMKTHPRAHTGLFLVHAETRRCGGGGNVVIDDSVHAFLESSRPEIDQQPNRQIQEAEICMPRAV